MSWRDRSRSDDRSRRERIETLKEKKRSEEATPSTRFDRYPRSTLALAVYALGASAAGVYSYIHLNQEVGNLSEEVRYMRDQVNFLAGRAESLRREMCRFIDHYNLQNKIDKNATPDECRNIQ